MAGFDPTQVPTFPVEIDWSHPLAAGLSGVYLPAIVPFNLVNNSPLAVNTAGSIGGTKWGPGSSAQLTDSYVPVWQQTATNCCVWFGNLTSLSANANFFQGIYAQPDTSPYATYGFSANASNGTIYGQWNTVGSFNGVDATYSASLGNQCLAVNWVTQEIGVFVNGALDGGMAGGYGPTYSSTSSWEIGGPGSYTAAALNYARDLPPSLLAWLASEPFAMLRPVRRRTYFVPASSGASLSVAGRVAPFVASVGLKFGASASIQAASPPFFADVALAPQVQATIAGAVHPFDSSIAQEASASAAIAGASAKPSAAFALAAQVETTIAGIERELSAAIDLNTGNAAFIEVSGALPPFRSSIAEVVSASASVAGSVIPPQGDIAALLSAAMSVASHVYGPSANVRLSAGVTATMDIAAILGPLSSAIAITPAVPSSRIIRAQPVVRETSPLGAAPIAFWSQRAAGDVDTFSVDFSPLLAAGEALTGTPAVTVPTGDLTIADVTMSGSTVSFTISGAGTQGNYSSILIEAATTSERTIALTGMVVTGAFLPSLPNPDMGAMLRVSPVFGPRAAGDADIYAVDFSPWLDVGETITGCTVSALTADLAVSQASYAGSIVTWQASGSGTPGAWTAFLAIVQTSAGRTLGLYCGVRTARG